MLASAAVTALSTPPETPTTARRSRAFAISSRMKRTSILRTSTSSIRSGDGSFGSGLITPVRANALVTAVERETETAGDVAKDDVLALVPQEWVTCALAGDELRIDLADEQLFVELGRARGNRAVGRDDLRTAPERDPVLVADAIHVHDVHGEIGRVEAIHEPTRLRGAEVAALGDAAARARGWSEDDRRPRRRVEVWGRNVPQVLADRDAGRSAGPAIRLETIARAEVAPVVEDAVRRQVDLAVHVHELPARPVSLRDVQLRVGRALDEAGADVDVPRSLGDTRELRIVGREGHVRGEVLQVIARERKLRKDHEARAGSSRAGDPLLVHVQVAFHGAERRRALRDRD